MNFHVRERDERGRPTKLQSSCKTCQKLQARVNQGMRRRGRPYGPRGESKTGYKKQTPEERAAHSEYRKSKYREEMEDADRREARRERERMNANLRRRREGVPERKFKKKRRNGTPPTRRETLPVAPLAEWLRRNGVINLPGVHPREISRIKREEEDPITLDKADRVLVAADQPWVLHELYPL